MMYFWAVMEASLKGWIQREDEGVAEGIDENMHVQHLLTCQ